MSLTFLLNRLHYIHHNGDKMNKVTVEQIELWLGSDTKRSEIIELLVELANGEYDPQIFRQDIIDLWDQV